MAVCTHHFLKIHLNLHIQSDDSKALWNFRQFGEVFNKYIRG